MQKEADNTKWWILGGAAALLGAALIWQSYSDEDEKCNEHKFDEDDLMEMLKAEKLLEVKKDGALINAQYFLELLQFIITTVKKQDEGPRKIQVDARRVALKANDMDKYTEIVREMLMKEEHASNDFLQKVIELLGINQQEFEMTHGKLMQHPQTQELVMMAQQGQLKKPEVGGGNETPKINKVKTMEYIKRLKETSGEKMKDMAKKQQDMEQQAKMGGQQDPMEMMVMMMVEQAKMSDEAFNETQIEQEDFEKSVMYFCAKDPEVKMAMQAYMMEMQMAMQQPGGGGMGGGPGPQRR